MTADTTTHTTGRADTAPVLALSFQHIAGLCGLAAGLSTFLYAISFVILKNAGLSALLLMVGGLLSTAVLVAVYTAIRPGHEEAALWSFALGLAGAMGAAIHGAYDLANVLHPQAGASSLPNAVDPRGLLTFGVTGLSVLVITGLIRRLPGWPAALSAIGYTLTVLLVVIYLTRLIVLDATSPLVVIPVLLAGFVVNPLWNAWLGLTLWRRASR